MRSTRRAHDSRLLGASTALLAFIACKSPGTQDIVAPSSPPPPIVVVPAPPPPPPPLPDVGAPAPGLSQDGAEDAALIVAIETYKFEDMPTVRGALENGKAWKSYLMNVRGVPEKRIRFLKDKYATDGSILRAIDELAPLVNKNGRLWFVFIGHGFPDTVEQGGLLVGVDAQANVEQIKDRSIPQSLLFKKLSATRGKPIAILDACFSGRDRGGDRLLKGLLPASAPPAPRKRGPKSRVLLLSAGTSEEYAGELTIYERPAFSYLLLGALRGWADDDKNGSVTVDEAIRYAREVLAAVLNQTRTQTPMGTGALTTVLSRSVEPDPGLITLLTAPHEALATAAPPPPSQPGACAQTHFGREWPPFQLPNLDVAARLRDKEHGSVESDLAYATALNAQKRGKESPAEALDSWCRLADLTHDNPHKIVAAGMCERWKAYSQDLAWLAHDLGCISKLKREGTGTLPDRLRHHVHAFVLRYGNLKWNQGVSDIKALVPYLDVDEVLVQATSDTRTYVDLQPVSVDAYKECVTARACSAHTDGPGQHCNSNYGGYIRESVRCLTPQQARDYCSWVGKRLPSTDALTEFFRRHATHAIVNNVPPGDESIAEDDGTFSSINTRRVEPNRSATESWLNLYFRCSRTVDSSNSLSPSRIVLSQAEEN